MMNVPTLQLLKDNKIWEMNRLPAVTFSDRIPRRVGRRTPLQQIDLVIDGDTYIFMYLHRQEGYHVFAVERRDASWRLHRRMYISYMYIYVCISGLLSSFHRRDATNIKHPKKKQKKTNEKKTLNMQSIAAVYFLVYESSLFAVVVVVGTYYMRCDVDRPFGNFSFIQTSKRAPRVFLFICVFGHFSCMCSVRTRILYVVGR